jgi:hypothetical protein
VKMFKKSSVATEKLMKKTSLTFVKDCSTRWNSCYLMVERMLTVRSAIKEVMEKMKMDSPTLHNDWTHIEQLAKILRPFKEQTDVMQTNTMALSNIIPTLLELNLALKDTSLSKSLVQTLGHSISQRFSCFLYPLSPSFDPIPAAACLLDPAVVMCMLRDDTQTLLGEARKYIKRMV